MRRADRLYALVEELRAVSPRPRSAAWLARRLEVSTRTVERDLTALRDSGLAIRGGTGRAGGYSLDREHTLPPVTLSPVEALAIGVALRSAAGTPFAAAARRAGQKVLAVLPADVRRREQALAERVHRFGASAPPGSAAVAETVTEAVATSRLLRLAYTDATGAATTRDVEPLGLLWGPNGWYLVGWCRLRDGLRGFQLDRIAEVAALDEHAPPRPGALAAELDRLDASALPEM